MDSPRSGEHTVSPWSLLESWLRDLRFAGRGLIRASGFAAAVFFTLLLCIGPNAATLSALYALAVKPLPFRDAEQLVMVVNLAEKSGGQAVLSSTTQYVDFQKNADLFSAFGTVRRDTVLLNADGAARSIEVDRVSASFFDVVDVRPVLGRLLSSDEEVAGKDRVIVLAERFWETQFHADPAVIGQTLLLGGQPCTIVGVAPRSLESLSKDACAYQPYAAPKSKFDPQTRYRGDLALYGRLKPDVTPATAQAQLVSLESHFMNTQAGPALRALVASAGYRLSLQPLRPGGAIGRMEGLWLLQGGALFVLLIGGANVANLFLARLNAKSSELAVRVALGAGRAALIRQTLAESLLLTGGATVAGIAVGQAAIRGFNHYLPLLIPGAPAVTLDPTVTVVLVLAATLISLLVGLMPLQLLWRTGLHVGSSRTGSSTAASRSVSGALVTAQVAFAVVLLVGAGLLLRSFAKVVAVNPGYEAAQVVHSRVTLPKAYNTPAARLDAQRRVLDAFRQIPGVENAAAALQSPVLGNERPVPFGLRGHMDLGESQPLIHILAVSPEFFATLGLRQVSGRGFDEGDDFAKRPVAIVDQTFGERYFAGRSTEGEEIYLNWGFPLGVDGWPRIVGTVSRANYTGLDSRDNLPIVYVPTVGFSASGFDVLVRSQRGTAEVVREMRSKLAAIDPTLTLSGAESLDIRLDHLLATRRGVTLLIGVFSVLALLLAAIGLYGVLAYDVSQRTREIGIRGAIGASPSQIVGLVVRQGLAKTAIGLGIGLVAALFLTRFLHSLLFGIVAGDPLAYGSVAGAFGLVALIACWIPARRASCIDPVIALRSE